MTEYRYTVLGLMSGTSLDGVDIAICSFIENKGRWNFNLHFTKTYSYDKAWKERLRSAYQMGGRELMELDRVYGDFLADIVNKSIKESGLMPDFIASHGQTIFHSPEKRMTCQIGHGANISVGTHLPVVCDFRSADVALGGQGAPLVPVGDQLLFPDSNSCLNLGGFANISFDIGGQRKAFDICPANIILNELSVQLGLEYDEDGLAGRKGNVFKQLLNALNGIEYYQQDMPKSLGYEWYEKHFIPLFQNEEIPIYDKLATAYYHIAEQVCSVFKKYKITQSLITGGGAHNKLLIEIISSQTNTFINIPDNQIVDFKEAIVFAFLGLMRFQNRINTLASVTGAKRDSIGGTIFMP